VNPSVPANDRQFYFASVPRQIIDGGVDILLSDRRLIILLTSAVHASFDSADRLRVMSPTRLAALPGGAAPGGTAQALIYYSDLRDQGAHHSPSILSTKRQGSNLMFANQVIWGNVGQRRPLVTPQ
jgi:hypothetical protein